ncbi:carboxymuconolactone decarboxylase [Burkholderia cenocepacia]|uniref:Carboxymuconolactone decarboxylase n=2 Tax=Burkholderia cenocepacia TaxID=95486 RepID=A0A3Q9F6R0_9BURK|nr:carboxymuconolactone decarboxylase [Burkholderia cenocepacia]
MSVIRAIGIEGFSGLSAALDRLDPDFRRLLIEGAYADIIARPNLSLKNRELVTVAVLTTMGNAESALRYHAGGMLNTGWTPEALLETVLQTLDYAGVPVAMAGLLHVAALLRERGVGVDHVADLVDGYDSAFAYLLQRRQRPFDALTPKERGLATLTIVIALENRHDAVRRHLNACLDLGWTRSELTEVLIQLTGYIGWPLVLPVSRIALAVFDTADGCPGSAQANAVTAPEAPERGIDAPRTYADMSHPLSRCLDALQASMSQPASIECTKAQHLTAIACLTCLARNADVDALVAHMRGALSLGASQREITDAIVGALPHAGVLAAQWALDSANRWFASPEARAASQQESAAA